MDFIVLGLEHIDLLRPYFMRNRCRICDCTVGGTFIWRDLFRTEFSIVDEKLYLKVNYLTGDIAFTPPRGEPCAEKESYERIIAYSSENGCKPLLCAVSPQRLEKVLALYPNASVTTNRDWSDYLYMSEDIKTLAGRKYSGQRNHINKFLREHGDWVFEEINELNLKEAYAFFAQYTREQHEDYPAVDECNSKTLEVLEHMDQYKLFGGVLRVGGDIIGGAIGEIIGDTLFVHIEKAQTTYQGAYPMLVNQFAKRFAVGSVSHINREEDDGVEGLRTSKQSYHPCALIEKYMVELK